MSRFDIQTDYTNSLESVKVNFLAKFQNSLFFLWEKDSILKNPHLSRDISIAEGLQYAGKYISQFLEASSSVASDVVLFVSSGPPVPLCTHSFLLSPADRPFCSAAAFAGPGSPGGTAAPPPRPGPAAWLRGAAIRPWKLPWLWRMQTHVNVSSRNRSTRYKKAAMLE